MPQKDATQIADSEDPDQTAPLGEQSDLELHCMPRTVCKKPDHCSIFVLFSGPLVHHRRHQIHCSKLFKNFANSVKK